MSPVRTRQARHRTQEQQDFSRRIQEARAASDVQSGECAHCEGIHAWPAARWSCSCGKELCWRQIIRGCGCGGEVEVRE